MSRLPHSLAGTAARLALLLLLAAGAACKDDPAPKPLVCPEGTVPDDTGGCVTPPDTCEAGAPGSIVASCRAAHRSCFEAGTGARCGPCLSGYVEENGACRERKSCADLACAAEYRGCVEGGDRADAACGDCLPEVAALEGACVPHTCEPNAPASLAAACAEAKRACVEEDGAEARCGDCWAGYADRGGACERVQTCADLGCAAAARSCTPETASTDATCGGCLAGYVERNHTCVRRDDATCDEAAPETNLGPACAAEHRSCDATATPARCGGCLDGFIEVAERGCVARTTCAELDCNAQHRACEETPNGHCAGCLPGFVEEPGTGACRPVRTCAELTCSPGEECVEGDEGDAFCRVDCGEHALWSGSRCEPCPPCTDEGEEGRSPTPTRAGACICRTSPGYFYSTAGDVGSFPCDADGDGWVRESARLALESTDPVLSANARCTLRTIDRVVLVNEAGESREVLLPAPLALYESDRNDDDALLRIHWTNKGLPGYTPEGTPPSAAELNRFTKLCHHPSTDYNDNGVADVEEWSGHARSPNVRADQAPFNELAYFAELHTGQYEPSATSPHGRYVIREKSRAIPPAGDSRVEYLALSYPAEDGDYWRQCDVDRDPAFPTTVPAVGFDFAVHSDPSAGFGMNHHSQFKCLVFENEPAAGAPQEWTPADAAARGFRLQTCRAAGDPVRPGPLNPALGDIACTPLSTAEVRPGDVAWGAVPYDDYGPHLPGSVYHGGCVNACIGALPTCPGYEVNPVAVACAHDPENFGKFVACDSWEVCDGLDNDGNGSVDDGNPGGGRPCETGLHGICAAGTTNCRGGTIVCDANLSPRGELCNNLDDDCDGEVDETFPEEGASCTVPGQRGACAQGTYVCRDGEVSCPQTVFPADRETCGNAIDENCNGQIDEGEDAIGCTDYHYDGDGDGYGTATTKRCLCRPDHAGKYTSPASSATDCCDSDATAHPGAGGWYSSPNACGSFDYDCNGQQNNEFNGAYQKGCGVCCSGFCCCDAAVGWANAVPPCGQSGTWYINDCSSWSKCNQEWETRVSKCR